MNEITFQRLWLNYAKLRPNIRTSNGQLIKILSPGQFNTSSSGPDFQNAVIQLDGETKLIGQIELHLKASDWYKHRHHLDPAYQNVILHVVLELDEAVQIHKTPILHFVFSAQNATESGIINEHFPCESRIENLPIRSIQQEKRNSLRSRFENKVKVAKDIYRIPNKQFLYELVAKAFGMKVNNDPMELLSRLLPYSFIHKFDDQIKEELLFMVAGLSKEVDSIENNRIAEHLCEFHGLAQMDAFVWRKKGLRPPGYPEKRLVQFSTFLHQEFLELFKLCTTADSTNDFNSTEIKSFIGKVKSRYGDTVSTSILVNGVWPFLYLTNRGQNYEVQIKLLEELSRFSPEKNNLLLKMERMGFRNLNAFDSQALLSLYKSKCLNRACIECEIGKELMKA